MSQSTPPRAVPVGAADEQARAEARALLGAARHAALAVIEPESGAPHLARIGLAVAPSGVAMSLISDLALHSRALAADPRCALLVGEPGTRGDPLTHPRLTVHADARFGDESRGDGADLRAHYVRQRPKARLYAGFADFRPVLFIPRHGFLNAGFGRAFDLSAFDLTIQVAGTRPAPAR